MDSRVKRELSRTEGVEPLGPLFACVRIAHELAGMTLLLGQPAARESVAKYALDILRVAVGAIRHVEGQAALWPPGQSLAEQVKEADHAKALNAGPELEAEDISFLVRALGGIVTRSARTEAWAC